MKTKNFRSLLGAHYPIIGVFLGALLVLLSMGTYTNWDAQTEFQAASSVVTRGFPYVTTGLMIDQPPFAFYMTAPVLPLFGLSYTNGVAFVTALGWAASQSFTLWAPCCMGRELGWWLRHYSGWFHGKFSWQELTSLTTNACFSAYCFC